MLARSLKFALPLLASSAAAFALGSGPAHANWEGHSFGGLPNWAASAGWEANGDPLYICRAQYSGGLHIGKIRHGFDGCNIGYGGQEITVSYYEVWTDSLNWAPGQGDRFSNAYDAGHEANGQPLFICRAEHAGGLHIGKIRPGFGGCNISYGGQEVTVWFYETGF